jgi:hypothetical protein
VVFAATIQLASKCVVGAIAPDDAAISPNWVAVS